MSWRLKIGSRLTAIVAASACGFVLIVVVGWLIDRRVHRQLVTIQQTYVPKVELGPRLSGQLAKLQRAFQDAVAAHDRETLDEAREARDHLLTDIDAARDAMSREDIATLRWAVQQYYAIASDVATRMMDNETGEAMLRTIAEMREHEHEVSELITSYTSIDRQLIDRTFAAVVSAQTDAARFRVVTALVFLVIIGVVSMFWSRRLLRVFNTVQQQSVRWQEALAIADKELDAFALLARRAHTGLHSGHIDLSLMARETANELAGDDRVTVADGLSVRADTYLARAVLATLIGNALRRTSGLAGARIEVGATTVDGVGRFYVRDNAKDHDTVSAKTIRARFDEVWVENTDDDDGTTFFFTFIADKPRVNS